jgi:hypothetical protein
MAAPSGRGRRGGTAGGTSAVPADAARTRRRVRRDAPMGIARRPTGELGPATSDGSRWSCLCGKALARDDDQRVQDRAGALRIELPPRSRRAPPLEGESEQKGKSKEREQLKQRHPRVRAIEVRPIGAGHAVTLCGIGARIEGPRAAWPCENHRTKGGVQEARVPVPARGGVESMGATSGLAKRKPSSQAALRGSAPGPDRTAARGLGNRCSIH